MTSRISGVVRRLVGPLPCPPAQVDAIVVLGAALRRDGRLGPSGRERVAAGARAWREGRAPWLLLTGGRVVPWGPTEADAMLEAALAAGVPRRAVLIEDRARSTEENARYSAAILGPMGLRRVLVVTQPFHARRSVGWFRRAGLEAAALDIADSWIYSGGWASARALRWIGREWVLQASLALRSRLGDWLARR